MQLSTFAAISVGTNYAPIGKLVFTKIVLTQVRAQPTVAAFQIISMLNPS